MKVLCLSTAEQGCSLAVADGNFLVCEEFWEAKLTHSRRVLKMIEHTLEKRAGMTPGDIDGFVAAKGPGSFTGLRIGISVIKGLAHALDKPCAGISSLDGIAFRFKQSSYPVCVMMDARRNEVYCSIYLFEHGRLASKCRECVVSPEDAVAITKGPTIFVGSGSKVYRSVIEKNADYPDFSHPFFDFVSAAALLCSIGLGNELGSGNDFFERSCNKLVPSYIRKSDAQLQFAEKLKGQ